MERNKATTVVTHYMNSLQLWLLNTVRTVKILTQIEVFSRPHPFLRS